MPLEDKRNLLRCCYRESTGWSYCQCRLCQVLSAAAAGDDSTAVVSARAVDVETSVYKHKRLKVMDGFEDEDSDEGIFTTVTQCLSSKEKQAVKLILCCTGETAITLCWHHLHAPA